MSLFERYLNRAVAEADQRQASIREATGGDSPNYTLVFRSVLTGQPIDEASIDPLMYLKFPQDKDEP